MTTKQNPTVKVGDELALATRGFYRTTYQVSKVTRITPSGRIVTDKGWMLNPDLTFRGSTSRFCKAIPWTKELREKDDKECREYHARVALDDVKWMKVPGEIAVKLYAEYDKLTKESEAKNAQEKSE